MLLYISLAFWRPFFAARCGNIGTKQAKQVAGERARRWAGGAFSLPRGACMIGWQQPDNNGCWRDNAAGSAQQLLRGFTLLSPGIQGDGEEEQAL